MTIRKKLSLRPLPEVRFWYFNASGHLIGHVYGMVRIRFDVVTISDLGDHFIVSTHTNDKYKFYKDQQAPAYYGGGFTEEKIWYVKRYGRLPHPLQEETVKTLGLMKEQ